MPEPPQDDTLETLFRSQSEELLRFLTRRLGDADRAADVAQDTWARLLRARLPTRMDNPRAFIFRTASNLLIDSHRRDSLERAYSRQQSEQNEEAASPSAERVASARERLAGAQAALAELPETTRQAFVMHRQRNLSYPEIATALGVSVSMVEKHVMDALKHLRRALP